MLLLGLGNFTTSLLCADPRRILQERTRCSQRVWTEQDQKLNKKCGREHCVPHTGGRNMYPSIRISNWSTKWKPAPKYTTCAINEIIWQLSRTRVREELIGRTTDKTRRKRHQYPGRVKHVLSGCPELAQQQYLWRHDDVLKHVLNALSARRNPSVHIKIHVVTITTKKSRSSWTEVWQPR